jgi:hypothetical protein
MPDEAAKALIEADCGRSDVGLLDFVYELGEIAARGDDIRPRLFGAERTP